MSSNQLSSSQTAPVTYGEVVLDGIRYIERHQVFVFEQRIDTPNQEANSLRLTLPGVANFLLKGLGRDFTIPGDFVSHNRIFRFRLINSEGTTWFFTGALGLFDDRVFDTLCFGNAQFPFPIIPPVPVHANGSLVFDIQDVGVLAGVPLAYPYIIHLAFYGDYLFPAIGNGAGRPPLSFNGRPGVLGA